MKKLILLVASLVVFAGCGNSNGFYSGTTTFALTPSLTTIPTAFTTSLTLYQVGSTLSGDMMGTAAVTGQQTQALSCSFSGTNSGGTVNGAVLTCAPFAACSGTTSNSSLTGNFTINNKTITGSFTGTMSCGGTSYTVTGSLTGTTS